MVSGDRERGECVRGETVCGEVSVCVCVCNEIRVYLVR